MIDWSSIFNIVFVAVGGVFAVFFLIAVIVVAVKGKRAPTAGDIAVRILATLALVAGGAMFFFAALAMADGGFCIKLLPEVMTKTQKVYAPVLVVGSDVTELPLPELFVMLASQVGSNLVAVLFATSLVALIVDCLVANKKREAKETKEKNKTVAKPTEQKKQLTEQQKRQAELEKIKRIGDAAVRKTSAAAVSADKSRSAAKDGAGDGTDDEPRTDWRVAPKKEHKAASLDGFISRDEGFDTFDDVAQPQSEESADSIETSDGATDDDFIAEQDMSNAEPQDVVAEQDMSQDNAEAFDAAQAAYDDTSETFDAPSAEEYDFADEQNVAADENLTEQADFDDTAAPEADDFSLDAYNADSAEGDARAESYEDTQNVTVEPEVRHSAFDDRDNSDYFEQTQPTDNFGYAAPSASVKTPRYSRAGQSTAAPRASKPSRIETNYSYDDHIEPDRNIYIPKMRTVDRRADGGVKRDGVAAKRQAATGSTQSQKPQESASAKKRAATTKPRKSTSPRGAKPVKGAPQNNVIPPEKKLPVTRRYVILDRRNAVNMFGEYLNERNRAQKEKLQSSINTIIIE